MEPHCDDEELLFATVIRYGSRIIRDHFRRLLNRRKKFKSTVRRVQERFKGRQYIQIQYQFSQKAEILYVSLNLEKHFRSFDNKWYALYINRNDM